jgi:dolichol-phosphate mannosyltransferase
VVALSNADAADTSAIERHQYKIPEDDTMILLASPVHNEASSLDSLARELERNWIGDVYFANDGSTDGSDEHLRFLLRPTWALGSVVEQSGYGATTRRIFEEAKRRGAEYVITIDADLQHDPAVLQRFVAAIEDTRADIVSGSRYLPASEVRTQAPGLRTTANLLYCDLLHKFTGLHLTDAWCGLKAYRTSLLDGAPPRARGYSMPLEFWVQAARADARVVEVPVPLIYNQRDFKLSEDTARNQALARECINTFVQAIATDLPGHGTINATNEVTNHVMGQIVKYRDQLSADAVALITNAIESVNCPSKAQRE